MIVIKVYCRKNVFLLTWPLSVNNCEGSKALGLGIFCKVFNKKKVFHDLRGPSRPITWVILALINC